MKGFLRCQKSNYDYGHKMKNQNGKSIVLRISLMFATLAIGVALGIWLLRPPAPPHEGTADYPAYQRMMANIQRLAARPHPSGSLEIENTRDMIIAEIAAMGLTPVIEHAELTISEIADKMMWLFNTTKEDFWEQNQDLIAEMYGNVRNVDEFAAAHLGDYFVGDTLILQNILVKLDSPGTDRGVLFVAHYDSVSGAPGVSDDMVAVCALLEAMRAQAQNNELKNDIFFLLTDGEEVGLLGAHAFVDAHPELRDSIDMVVNIEARGNRGGLILFETSSGAYPLLDVVMRSDAKPVGFSVAASIYSMMPNDTDLSVFLRAGYSGINLAVIEGVDMYHQPSDDYENLSRASAWHYLHTALALADYAANTSLDELSRPPSDAVYFTFLPGIMVVMSIVVSHILCAVACILAIVSAVLQAKKKVLKVSFSNIIMGLLVLLSVLCAIFFAAGSYLFYMPLLVIAITSMFKKWTFVHIAVRAVSGIVALLLWIPIVFLVWVSLVQPMML